MGVCVALKAPAGQEAARGALVPPHALLRSLAYLAVLGYVIRGARAGQRG